MEWKWSSGSAFGAVLTDSLYAAEHLWMLTSDTDYTVDRFSISSLQQVAI